MTTLVQDPDCRRCVCGDCNLGLLASSHGNSSPGMAYMSMPAPEKCRRWPWPPATKNHDAMMKNATKVPNNTVFFMDNGQLYSTSGMLDPTGNFYLP